MFNLKTFSFQLIGNLAASFACPLQSCNWISSSSVLQKFFERLQDSRLFFSTSNRPAPERRIPEGRFLFECPISLRPRAIVVRLNPVISAVGLCRRDLVGSPVLQWIVFCFFRSIPKVRGWLPDAVWQFYRMDAIGNFRKYSYVFFDWFYFALALSSFTFLKTRLSYFELTKLFLDKHLVGWHVPAHLRMIETARRRPTG